MNIYFPVILARLVILICALPAPNRISTASIQDISLWKGNQEQGLLCTLESIVRIADQMEER